MSFNDVYEFIQGEYQQVTRIRQEPVSTADPTFFKDLNLVKWAGFSIEIWSAETGGTQLVQGLDYELQYLDVAASGPAGEPVYSGYSILTPLYYNIPLYQTANIVGAYTTRPYRPSYNVITTDTTVTPVSMDDSVIADATGGSFTVTIADGFHLNQRYSIICKGLGTVTVVGTGISAAAFTGVGVSWLWDGGEWMPLAAPGAREGGFYYDYVPAFIRPDTDPISATIPDFLATYGPGFFYIGLEFTYQGTTDKTNGTFAIADDGIDKYAVLAVDVAGGDSTLSIQWQWDTDTMVAIETGTDFTDLNLWAVYRWEKVTYGGYGAWANTAEAPPYGEAITSEQELYLDGTKEFISSDGNAPVVNVVDYLPAVINVDGAETPEPNSKWPGQRGTYPFFGEYENGTAGSSLQPSNASSSIEGDWLKVEVTVSGNAYINIDIPSSANDRYVYCLVRKGTDFLATVVLLSNTAGANPNVSIDWSGYFVFNNTAVDAGCVFINDELAVIKFTAPGLTTYDKLRLLPNNITTPTIGDYAYYNDWMVTETPYAVPYQAGSHQPAKLQFNKDWSQSTEWTIQGWFKTESAEAASKYCIQSRGPNNSNFNFIIAYIDDSGILSLITSDAGGTTSVLPGNAVTLGEYFHIKVTYISATSAELFQNGVSVGTITTNIPISSDMFKTLYVGGSFLDSGAITNPLNGYGNDVTIQPGIDTSDEHYLSGLPHYNPNKTYGKNASWSIDSKGHISGNNQLSGSIIQDEEINGQWVTRWDTGRMEINAYGTITTALNVAEGALFRSETDDPLLQFLYSYPFIEPASVAGDYQTAAGAAFSLSAFGNTFSTSMQLVAYRTTALASGSVVYSWQATGRWK